jgi:hypothetical protein
VNTKCNQKNVHQRKGGEVCLVFSCSCILSDSLLTRRAEPSSFLSRSFQLTN